MFTETAATITEKVAWSCVNLRAKLSLRVGGQIYADVP